MVSTEVCGSSSSGSNPDRHPKIKHWTECLVFLNFGVPIGIRKTEATKSPLANGVAESGS